MSETDFSQNDRFHQGKRLGWVRILELAGIFAIFFIQGAWPVPDTNEPHYLGKAIHYWNPEWIQKDFFLDSPDAHDVFYFTFGWLARYLDPAALAWVGRLLTWAWLAWAWQRLSWAVVPRPGYALLSGAVLAALMDRAHMAGEWVIGGVEAKGFAWALVWMGLERLLKNHWNWALVCFGAGSSFHALVGGWGGIAAGLCWLLAGKNRPPLRSLWPGILGGFLLALPGLYPVARLNWGVDPDIVRQGYQIYVEIRLPHHLDFLAFRPEYQLRFLLLCVACWVLGRSVSHTQSLDTLRRYGWAAMAIVGCGIVFSVVLLPWPNLRITLLRYYWFRLGDIIVPVATSLFLIRWIAEKTALVAWGTASSCQPEPKLPPFLHCFSPPWCFPERPKSLLAVLPWTVMVLASLGGVLHLVGYAWIRIQPVVPRAFNVHKDRWKTSRHQLADYIAWRKMCAWIQQNTPPETRFLTPREEQTFKWYAHRSEVATWKDIPQDAPGLVEWWRRLNAIYGTGSNEPGHRWIDSLTQLPPDKLRQLAQTYQAQYLVVESRPRLPFRCVYRNSHWSVYEILPSGKTSSPISPSE